MLGLIGCVKEILSEEQSSVADTCQEESQTGSIVISNIILDVLISSLHTTSNMLGRKK